MQLLEQAGKARHRGISNLDVADMAELMSSGGSGCVTDQIIYILGRR